MKKLALIAILAIFTLIIFIPTTNAQNTVPTHVATFNSQPAPYINPHSFITSDNKTWLAVANVSSTNNQYLDLLIYPTDNYNWGADTNGTLTNFDAIPFAGHQQIPTGFPAVENYTDGTAMAIHPLFCFDNNTDTLYEWTVYYGEGQYRVEMQNITYNPATADFTDNGQTVSKNYTTKGADMQNHFHGNNTLELTWTAHNFIGGDGNATVIYACNLWFTTDYGAMMNEYLMLYLNPYICRTPAVLSLGTPTAPYPITWMNTAVDTTGNIHVLTQEGTPNQNKWTAHYLVYNVTTEVFSVAGEWDNVLQPWIFPYSNNWYYKNYLQDATYNHTVTSYSLLAYPQSTWTEDTVTARGTWTVLEPLQKAGNYASAIWNVSTTTDYLTGEYFSQNMTWLLNMETTNIPTSRLFPTLLVTNGTNNYRAYFYSTNQLTQYYNPIYQNNTNHWFKTGGIRVNTIAGYQGYSYPSYVTENYIITNPSGQNFFRCANYYISTTSTPITYPEPPTLPVGLYPELYTSTVTENAPIGYMILLPFFLLFVPSILVGYFIGRTGFIATFGIMLAICAGITISGVVIIPAWIFVVAGIGLGVMAYLQFTGKLSSSSEEGA